MTKTSDNKQLSISNEAEDEAMAAKAEPYRDARGVLICPPEPPRKDEQLPNHMLTRDDSKTSAQIFMRSEKRRVSL